MTNSKNKHFISFLKIVLCSEQCNEMSIHLPPSHGGRDSSLCPTSPSWTRSLPVVTSQPSQLSDPSLPYPRACFQVTLLVFNNGPKAIHIAFITMYRNKTWYLQGLVLSAASEATGGVGETTVFIYVYGEKPDSGGFKEEKKRRQKPANIR